MADADGPLLDVRGLEKRYPITEGVLKRRVGTVHAVDGVSFTVEAGETFGLVGESGCGKSTVATTLLRLEDPTGGSVLFDGRDVTEFDEEELKRFRREAQVIFQDPDSGFDPRMTVGESVTEPLRIHGLTDREHRREVGQDLVERAGLAAADYDRYPHEFSGGQRQRLALARALVVNPRLLVADEPVSALDVSVQSEILSLLAELQREFGLAVLFISHDLAVIREICDRVAVMYLGEIVEIGPIDDVYSDPKHPYTEALLSAIPEPAPDRREEGVRLSGNVPDAKDPPSGCRFHTRCPAVIQPPDVDVEQGTWRRLLDARERVAEDDVDVEAIRELAAAEVEGGPRSPSRHTVETAIRSEFDLADPIPDSAIERAVEEAVSALAEGDVDGAAEQLDAVIETPCEKYEPVLQPIGDGHDVACHLHHPPEGSAVEETADSTTTSEFEWVGERPG